jgi:hypothetical protein
LAKRYLVVLFGDHLVAMQGWSNLRIDPVNNCLGPIPQVNSFGLPIFTGTQGLNVHYASFDYLNQIIYGTGNLLAIHPQKIVHSSFKA